MGKVIDYMHVLFCLCYSKASGYALKTSYCSGKIGPRAAEMFAHAQCGPQVFKVVISRERQMIFNALAKKFNRGRQEFFVVRSPQGRTVTAKAHCCRKRRKDRVV